MTDGKIRVLRVLEYVYDDMSLMAMDMQRWTIGPTATREVNPGITVRSSYMMPEFMPGDLYEPPDVGNPYRAPTTEVVALAARVRVAIPTTAGVVASAADVAEWLILNAPQYTDKKIQFIKEIRTQFQVGLKEAKDLAELMM